MTVFTFLFSLNHTFICLHRGSFENKTSRYEIDEDRARAIRIAITTAKPGDVIAVIGKGCECYNIDKNGYSDFNEKEMKEIKNILFMIDTSASMSDRQITDCYSEVFGAIQQFNGKLQGKLGFFDAKVV